MKYLFAIHPPLSMTAVSWALAFEWNILFSLFGLMFIGDTIARTLEYIKLRKSIYSESLAHRYRKSWCGRTLVKARHGKKATLYYKMAGYRWYHLFPDKTFSRNTPLLKIKFWKSIFTAR